MSEEDLKINAKVRKILVESDIDLSALNVRTTSGAVTITGELKRFSARRLSERRVAKLLSVLETAILRSKGVKRVSFSIETWKKSKGTWKRTTK